MLLHSASGNASGIPQMILDEKAEELRKKKEMQDAINVRLLHCSAIAILPPPEKRSLYVCVTPLSWASMHGGPQLYTVGMLHAMHTYAISLMPAPFQVAMLRTTGEAGGGA